MLRPISAVWSLSEIFLCLIISVSIPGIFVFGFHLIMQIFAANIVKVCGCGGLIVSTLVVSRHILPYKEILNYSKYVPEWIPSTVQSRDLPFIFVVFEVVLGVFGLASDWPLTMLAFCVSWVYIRYCMYFSYADVRGDHSNEFSFSSLFPKLLVRGFVDQISCIVYVWAVKKLGPRIDLKSVDKLTVLYSPNDTAGLVTEMRTANYERKNQALMLLDENIASLTREEIAEV